MAKLSSIKADMEKVDKGRRVPYAPGIELLIASSHNQAYRTARTEILKHYMRSRRSRSLTPDEIVELIKPAVAKHLLLGWWTLEDEEGKAIPYSPKQALEYFNNPELRDLYDFVLVEAGENEAYRQEILEGEAGNLKPA